MRTALLTDLHANLQALTAVLADVRDCGLEAIACLGDIVGYGADPRRCLELIRALDCPCVIGNHDSYAVIESLEMDELMASPEVDDQPVWSGIKLAREQLLDEQIEWLRGLEPIRGIDGAVIAHAALHGFGTWPYLRSPADALPTLRMLENQVGFFGHTHRENVFVPPDSAPPEQLDENVIRLPQGGVAVTVGSVGQPRDGDARARWAIWDPGERTVEFRRVPYDVEAASEAIFAAGLCPFNAIRLFPHE